MESISISFSIGLVALGALITVQAQRSEGVPVAIESARIHFYETKQIRGEENYQITKAAGGELILTVKTELPFAEQETKPSVNTTLRMRPDLTPTSFETKGPDRKS